MPPRSQLQDVTNNIPQLNDEVYSDLIEFEKRVRALGEDYYGYSSEGISEEVIDCFSLIGRYTPLQPRLTRDNYEEFSVASDWSKALLEIEKNLKAIRSDEPLDQETFEYLVRKIISTAEIMVSILKLRGRPNFFFES